ncbi:MAG: HAD-IA family hydrolase [Clostridia bacterium]|nr:HAD-IA family hydrolase [Clostridia bacterium]
MKIKAVIWDLDGTLLNTLDDLTASTNAALAANGLPARTMDEVREFVGNGVRKLIERAMPELGDQHPKFQQTLDAFVAHYGAHSKDRTRPYDGILDVLDALSQMGVKHAIVSNKVDFAVKALSAEYFGDRMLSAVGDDPSRAKKPAPDSVWEAMRQMGVKAEEAVYVGDSDVDVITARNAGIPCIAVTWGFRSEACLLGAGAQHMARKPGEIAAIVEKL